MRGQIKAPNPMQNWFVSFTVLAYKFNQCNRTNKRKIHDHKDQKRPNLSLYRNANVFHADPKTGGAKIARWVRTNEHSGR